MDLIEQLTKEHREADELLDRIGESGPGAERNSLLDQLEEALTEHMRVEEVVVYPLVRSVLGDEEAEGAENEHDLIRSGIAQMRELADEDGFKAAVDMLVGGISHHVEEEESDLFPKLVEAAADRLPSAEEAMAQARLDRSTRAELYDAAREAEIPGRSTMTKDELRDALS